MPEKEEYGAQPPIEILRQFIDQGGWYNNNDSELPFMKLINLILVAAMGVPGGGRTFITPRMTRHFNLISLATFDDGTMTRIFKKIMNWFLQNNFENDDIKKMENKIVAATLDMYSNILDNLKATPTKQHYQFNLRDFAKVICGICMADESRIETPEQMVRIWQHEIWRVFADRLVNNEDKKIVLDLSIKTVKTCYNMTYDKVFEHFDSNKDGKVNTVDEIRALMFSDLLAPPGSKKIYEEIQDTKTLQTCIEEKIADINMVSDNPVDLVMFNFAIEHIVTISRILKQPGGNALLIGLGGSGRQSLTKLSCEMAEIKVFQITLTKAYSKNEWREDMRLMTT